MSLSVRDWARFSAFESVRFNLLFVSLYGAIYLFDTPNVSFWQFLAILNGVYAVLIYPGLLYMFIKEN